MANEVVIVIATELVSLKGEGCNVLGHFHDRALYLQGVHQGQEQMTRCWGRDKGPRDARELGTQLDRGCSGKWGIGTNGCLVLNEVIQNPTKGANLKGVKYLLLVGQIEAMDGNKIYQGIYK